MTVSETNMFGIRYPKYHQIELKTLLLYIEGRKKMEGRGKGQHSRQREGESRIARNPCKQKQKKARRKVDYTIKRSRREKAE